MRLIASLMTTVALTSLTLVGCANSGGAPKRQGAANDKSTLSQQDRCALQESRGQVMDVDCPPSSGTNQNRRARTAPVLPQDPFVTPGLPGLGAPGGGVLGR